MKNLILLSLTLAVSNTFITSAEVCIDKRPDCEARYKKYCGEAGLRPLLQDNCAKTCSYCTAEPPGTPETTPLASTAETKASTTVSVSTIVPTTPKATTLEATTKKSTTITTTTTRPGLLTTISAILNTTTAAVSTAAPCADKSDMCQILRPYCQELKGVLKGRCDETCGWCVEEECKDTNEHCATFEQYCVTGKGILSGLCDRTCGYCGSRIPRTNCVRTTGGNSDGKCCRFPFLYGGKEYRTCIRHGNDQLWCGTTYSAQRWGNCVIPTTTAPTTTALPTTTAHLTTKGRCEDTVDCVPFKSQCGTHKALLAGNCDRTCGYCIPETTIAPTTVPPTEAPTTKQPIRKITTTKIATTKVPTTKVPTTKVPTTKVTTTKVPTTVQTTKAPTTKPALATTVQATPSCVKTEGGNSNGRCCHFPFVYGGTEYYTCTISDHDRLWCGTAGGLWGNCIMPTTASSVKTTLPATTISTTTTPTTPAVTTVPVCVKTEGGNGEGACCKFPFIYLGVEYNQCINIDHTQYWCGTTYIAYKWGNCIQVRPTTKVPETTASVEATTTTTSPAQENWGSWGKWGMCSKPCGTGVHNRKRKCNDLAGIGCPGPNTQDRFCNDFLCPVDGHWGPWSRYGMCSKPCGVGIQTRVRKCDNPPAAHGGFPCVGSPVGDRFCLAAKCPVHGQWGPWATFSRCSKTCGPGFKERRRLCDRPTPLNGGYTCAGPHMQRVGCQEKPCKVDGQWGQWGTFSKCSKTCGPGFMERRRLCDSPKPSNDGLTCTGPQTQRVACQEKSCKVPGSWGLWSEFSRCSETCGEGTQVRTRSCDRPAPENGGERCHGSDREERFCSNAPCPKTVNGKWGAWKWVGDCSKSCGTGGRRLRVRSCNNPPPSNGGERCKGAGHEELICEKAPCRERPLPPAVEVQCERGFVRNKDNICVDKDECSTPLRCAHIPNTVCVNRIGSFRCACKDGFTRTATGCKRITSGEDSNAIIEGNCMKSCTRDYRPICGSDGKTYGNKCMFEIGQCENPSLKEEHGGECKESCMKSCTRDYRPICGSDGKTYGNKCMFEIGQCENPSLKEEYGGECKDVDECLDPRRCAHIPNTYCRNTIGSYRCTCVQGYTRTATGCEKNGISDNNIVINDG